MEEKKQIKISFNMFIVIILLIITIVATITFLIVRNSSNKKEDEEIALDTIEIENYKNQDVYIIKGDYSGEYDLQFINLTEYNEVENFEKKKVMNYSEYKSYCNEWGLKKTYSDSAKNYIVFSYIAYDSPILEARLATVEYDKNEVNLYIWDKSSGFTVDISAYCVIVPTEKEISNVNVIPTLTNKDFNSLKENDTYFAPSNPYFDPNDPCLDKPVIYLYPTEETEVSVKLLDKERITCSYPKYIDGWDVLAKPNGNLIDLDTGRNLYSLYYESESVEKFNVVQEGFVVKGEDSAKFLEEKLEVLGLTERETEEFIIYWLPKLESNKYNYIRFATTEEINSNMALEINPKPDTVIRIIMTFKGLEKPIDVEEQKLVTPERNGFTVVEWGGTEIK